MSDEQRKADFDKRWKTCATCGTVDGQDKSNYVYSGKCRKCRESSDNAYDFKQAQENGSIRRDDSIMCPYCGHVLTDVFEEHNSKTFTCGKCERDSDLDVEYTVHFTTTKRDDAQ